MGVIIDGDLRYLAAATGDEYHRMRADDSTAWMMQNLELYPEKSGYGQYGITSERFCPSDGLVTERYSDGHPYSSWFPLTSGPRRMYWRLLWICLRRKKKSSCKGAGQYEKETEKAYDRGNTG